MGRFEEGARPKATGSDKRCAIAHGKTVIAECPGLSETWTTKLDDVETSMREEHGMLLADGNWIAEFADEVRFWEVTGQGAELRARVDHAPSGPAVGFSISPFLASGRLAFSSSEELLLMDRGSFNVHRFAGATLALDDKDHTLLATSEGIRRLRTVDLTEHGFARWDTPPEEPIGVLAAHRVRKGAGIVFFPQSGDDQLLSFDGAIHGPSGMSYGDVRRDGERLVGYTSNTVLEVDATTGHPTAKLAAAESSEEGRSIPAYARDPRYVFWFEIDGGPPDRGPRVVVAVGDLRTGKVARTIDPRADILSGLGALNVPRAFVDPDSDQLCADFSQGKISAVACDWSLSNGVARRRNLPRSPLLERWPKALLLDRASSPDGTRVALLSTDRKGVKDGLLLGQGLRLTVATSPGDPGVRAKERIEPPRDIDVALHEVQLDVSCGPYLPKSRGACSVYLDFVDDTHIVVTYVANDGAPPGTYLVDTTTWAVTGMCESSSCGTVGRFVVVDAFGDSQSLQDPITKKTFSLTPSREAWERAILVAEPCPQ